MNHEKDNQYEPIAVIGLACRFPGANNPDEFWNNLLHGVESRRVFSRQELLRSGIPPEVADSENCIGVACALDDIDCFDAGFFGYSPQEARLIDPQQRLFLECSWHAFENAGYIPHEFMGRAGVFAGCRLSTYANLLPVKPYGAPSSPEEGSALSFQSLLSNDKDYLCSRVAYKLGLEGPAISIQTACSTSLVAVHMACQSLQMGECEVALAGGAALLVPQESAFLSQEGMILSPTGHCRPFSSDADGTIMGHGVGVVLLKHLDDALRDKDYIHAVIRGSAVNNDGKNKAGFTAPGFRGQSAVIAEAMELSGLEADSIEYIESHGTGTALGDPLEIASLNEAFSKRTKRTGFCRLGAVKANIGHLDSAAGIAGFIKAVLAVREGKIPPLINFNGLNPRIDLTNSPFVIEKEGADWSGSGGLRRAGVSSFGIGGTNCHVILETAPQLSAAPRTDDGKNIFVLSARGADELQNYARSFADALPLKQRLQDICHTVRNCREQFACRAAFSVSSQEELKTKLASLRRCDHQLSQPLQAAFLFTGQGSQYPGMARALYSSSPYFAAQLDECANIYSGLTGENLRSLVFEADAECLRGTDIAQPALFAVEYALARTFMHWGVRPAVMIGHSLGEYVAACLAGVFSLRDAVRLVVKRGSLMAAAPGCGGMAAVSASEADLLPLLAEYPGLNVAALNAPLQTIVSGEKTALESFLDRLAVKGIGAKELQVSNAFHSQLMDAVLPQFRSALAECELSEPTIPIVSNLGGRIVGSGEMSSPEYWVRHMREKVSFFQGLECLWQQGCNFLLEFGPQPVLVGLAGQHPSAAELEACGVMRRGADELGAVQQALCNLYCRGARIEWNKVDFLPQGRKVPVPGYPFSKKRYWVESPKLANNAEQLAKTGLLLEDQEEIFGDTLVYRQDWEIVPFTPNPAGKWLLLASGSEIFTASSHPDLGFLPEGSNGWGYILIANYSAGEALSGGNAYSASLSEFTQKLRQAALLLENQPEKRLVILLCGEPGKLGSDTLIASKAAASRVFQWEYPQIQVSLVVDKSGDIPAALAAACSRGLPEEACLRDDGLFRPVLQPENSLLHLDSQNLFRQDSAYIITGGTGDIGPALAAWMASAGARHIILLGRREVTGRDLLAESLAAFGSKVYRLSCDLGDPAAISNLGMMLAELPPVRGVFHLAGSIADAMITQVSAEDFGRTYSSKVLSAKNLLENLDGLDFAVFFSSVSACFGFHGQAAYAAANAALDELCRSYRKSGVPVILPHWGAWALGKGSAYAGEKAEALPGLLFRQPGEQDISAMRAFEGSEALKLLGTVLSSSLTDPILIRLEDKRAGTEEISVDLLSGNEKSQEVILALVLSEIKKLLEMEELPSPDANLLELGLDSLIFLILSQRLSQACGVRISPAALFACPTAAVLAEQVTQIVSGRTDPIQAQPAVAPPYGLPEAAETLELSEQDPFAPFPLTDVQYAYWVGRSSGVELGNIGCHIYIELDGEGLDVPRLEDALNRLIARHEMLRCVFLPEGLQRILPEVPGYRIEVEDCSAPGNLSDDALARKRQRMHNQVHDAFNWPLFEVKASLLPAGKTRLHVSMDLLLADFFSINIFMRELEELYAGPETELKPLDYSFRRYLQDEAEQRKSGSWEAAQGYWRGRLDSLPPAPPLPLAARPAELGVPRFRKMTGRIGAGAWQKLKKQATAHSITPSSLLLGVYAETLSLWSGSKNFCINLTLFNRALFNSDVMEVIGDFTSTSLLEVNLEAPTIGQRIEKLQEQFWRDMEHREYSGVRVIRDLHSKGGSMPGALMPVVFTSNMGERRKGGELGQVGYTASQTPQVWIDYQVLEEDGGLTVMWDVVDGLFPKDMPEAMFEANLDALERLAANAALWGAEALVQLPEEQQVLRVEYNATWATLVEGFIHSPLVTASTNAFRVLTGGSCYAAGEVMEKSLRYAALLAAQGVGQGDFVGVCLERGIEQVCAVYGVLLAGAAYIPMMPEWPQSRLGAVVEASGAAAVVSCGACPDGIKVLTPAEAASYQPGRPVLPDNAHASAYTIFTSGSTGLPKGVEITHDAVLNTILDINERFGVGSEDIILNVSELSFDLSVYDLFGALHGGSGLALVEEAKSKEPSHWLEVIRRSGVTVWNSAPQLMRMLVEYCEATGESLSTLRLILLSGDWIPTNLPERITRLAPGCQVISLGGATEASIWSIFHPVQPEDRLRESIPYGRPLRNQEMHVLDARLNPVPEWVPGDLYIGGFGLAKGYMADPEKTAASFIHHPKSGARLYRTGDLARFVPGNRLEFLGRSDFQLKIRGHRIEAGEIEAVLMDYPGLSNAVAVGLGGNQDEKRLVAYYTLSSGARKPEAEELAAHLGTRLPPYMIPSAFIHLDKLPVTSAGKVDRKALPAPHAQDLPPQGRQRELTTSEAQLAMIWESVLSCPVNDPQADFFSLGGDSLLAGRLVLKIRAIKGFAPPLGTVFENPTLEGLAAFLDNMGGQEGPAISSIDSSQLELQAILPADLKIPGQCKSPSASRCVFLTGATGFVGGAVLEELLRTESTKVICLVRGVGREEAQSRLERSMCERGCGALPLDRVEVLAGSLEQPLFGLDQAKFLEVAKRIHAVVHCGASVQYAQPLQTLAPVNIGGTVTALRLACATGGTADFIYISTAAVMTGAGGKVLQDTPLEHDGPVFGGYAQSKWVAERILRKAREKGLKLTVFRPGIVSGDSRNGFWNTEDFPCRFAGGCAALGKVPALERQFRLLPVNIAAKLIVGMSFENSTAGRDWNLIPPSALSLQECVLAAKDFGLDLETLPFEAWKGILLTECLKRPGNPLEPLLPLFPHSIDDVPSAPDFQPDGLLHAASRLEIDIPRIDSNTLGNYIRFLFPNTTQN